MGGKLETRLAGEMMQVLNIPYRGYLNNGSCDDELPADYGYPDYDGYNRKNDDEKKEVPKNHHLRITLIMPEGSLKRENILAVEYYDLADACRLSDVVNETKQQFQ